MRPDSVPSGNFEWLQDGSSLPHKIVRENRAKYKAFLDILDANPAILDMAWPDLEAHSTGGPEGRSATTRRRPSWAATGRAVDVTPMQMRFGHTVHSAADGRNQVGRNQTEAWNAVH